MFTSELLSFDRIIIIVIRETVKLQFYSSIIWVHTVIGALGEPAKICEERRQMTSNAAMFIVWGLCSRKQQVGSLEQRQKLGSTESLFLFSSPLQDDTDLCWLQIVRTLPLLYTSPHTHTSVF